MSLTGSISVHGNPKGWPIIPLRAVLTQSRADNYTDLPLLGVNLHKGVTRRSADDGRPAASEDLSAYKVVRPGDVVMNRLGKPHGSVGVSAWMGITSPAYWVMPVNPTLGHAGYFHHLLRSRHLIAEYERLGKNQPPNQFDISWDAFRAIEVPLPPLEEQRRIAEFLDAETVHIDRLIYLQEQVMERLAERERAQLDSAIDELVDRWGSVPLRRFLRGVDQGASPQAEAFPAGTDEWGVLKVSCLRPGRFIPDENKRLPSGLKFDVKHEVRAGDLLITRANTPQLVGSTAVVPRTRGKLLLSDKIFRVRLDQRITAEFIATVARGTRIRDLCAASSNGASQSMANIRFEEVKAWPIPAATLDAQHDVVRRVDRQRSALDELRFKIERQLLLLTERRQALITAAVTGQFDVTTASGRNVTEGVAV